MTKSRNSYRIEWEWDETCTCVVNCPETMSSMMMIIIKFVSRSKDQNINLLYVSSLFSVSFLIIFLHSSFHDHILLETNKRRFTSNSSGGHGTLDSQVVQRYMNTHVFHPQTIYYSFPFYEYCMQILALKCSEWKGGSFSIHFLFFDSWIFNFSILFQHQISIFLSTFF